MAVRLETKRVDEAELERVVGGRYSIDGVQIRRPLYRDGVNPDAGPSGIHDLICPRDP